MKKIFTLVIVVLLAVSGFFAYKYFTMPKPDDIALSVVLKDAEELTTQKIVIGDAFESTKGKIPVINKKKFLVKYSTTVEAGFDVGKVEVKETNTKVTIYIPHCTIDEESVKIKSSDIVLYDANFAVFNVDEEATLDVIGEAEKRAKKIASSEEYGFLAAADENAVMLVKGLFENAVDGRDVIVEFK